MQLFMTGNKDVIRMAGLGMMRTGMGRLGMMRTGMVRLGRMRTGTWRLRMGNT
jgi:hypothetical protein